MAMILLPPSESKRVPETRESLELNELSFEELNPIRRKVLDALVNLSEGRISHARKVLGLTANQDAEIERNRALLQKSVAPAMHVYTGVLFDAIGIDTLGKAALKTFERNAYVVSALFGLVSVADKIPAYRLSGSVALPKLGSMTNIWSQPIGQVLAQTDDFVIDLRSGTYQKLGPIPAGITENCVIPRILQKMPSGPPKVVSHHNKATKGRIVRQLSQTRSKIRTAEDLANVVAALGADVQIAHPKKSGKPLTLDVIVSVL